MDVDLPGPATANPHSALGLEPGCMLNGIYRVEHFVSRGGMGDVYAGVNVETEERVAIKAMLPRLAADPKILSLFRSEARLLTRVSHPAVAQYRVFARDSAIGVHYLVTDFIDGEPLTARLAGDPPNATEVEQLLRRLAAGLQAPHAIGAIHRDMSPDNVLLPGGRIERATIIDFGIARYVEPDDRTVVVEGFAGKLGYVAPEQFGLFGGKIGPWTDIYSTALVTLAFARADRIDMGRTIVEAVERRRTIPDLSAMPERLRPVVRAMLSPDPKERIASMEAVVAALESMQSSRPAIAATAASTHPAPTSRTSISHAILSAVVVCVVALTLLLWATSRPRPEERKATQLIATSSGRHKTASNPTTASPRPVAPTPVASQAPRVPPSIALTASVTSAGLRSSGPPCGPSAGVPSVAMVGGVASGTDATLLFVTASGTVKRLLGGEPTHAYGRASVRDAGTGRFRVTLCVREAGRAAYVFIAGAGGIPLLEGFGTEEAVQRYRDLSAQRGGAAQVAWLSVPPQPSPTPAALPEQADGPRTTQIVKLDASASLPSKAGSCRRFAGGTWYDLGALSRDKCVAAAFDRTGVVYAHVGGILVRRYDGAFEVQRGGRWRPFRVDRSTSGGER